MCLMHHSLLERLVKKSDRDSQQFGGEVQRIYSYRKYGLDVQIERLKVATIFPGEKFFK